MNYDIHIPEEELELIDQYLDNNLNAQELTALRDRAAEPEWAEKIAYIRLLRTGIGEAALRQKMEAFHAGMKKGTVRKMSSLRWKWMAAAGVVLILGTLWLKNIFGNKDRQLFDSYFIPDSGLVVSMGNSNNTGRYIFNRGMVEYKSEDYDKALEYWNGLTGNAMSDTLSYFIASALLANGQYSEALPYFEKVIHQSESIFLKDARWYAGLIHLRKGEKTKAKKLIRKSGNENKKEILQKIKE